MGKAINMDASHEMLSKYSTSLVANKSENSHHNSHSQSSQAEFKNSAQTWYIRYISHVEFTSKKPKKKICHQDTAPSVLHGRTCCGTRTPRGHPTRAATWSAPPRSSSGRRPRPKQRNWPRRHRRGRCSKRLVLVELRYGKWPMYRWWMMICLYLKMMMFYSFVQVLEGNWRIIPLSNWLMTIFIAHDLG